MTSEYSFEVSKGTGSSAGSPEIHNSHVTKLKNYGQDSSVLFTQLQGWKNTASDNSGVVTGGKESML